MFEERQAPSMSNPGIIATNITKKFLSACKSRFPSLSSSCLYRLRSHDDDDDDDANHSLPTHTALETGEIVKDGYFTLFEAVGALEVCVIFLYPSQLHAQGTHMTNTTSRSVIPRWTAVA